MGSLIHLYLVERDGLNVWSRTTWDKLFFDKDKPTWEFENGYTRKMKMIYDEHNFPLKEYQFENFEPYGIYASIQNMIGTDIWVIQ